MRTVIFNLFSVFVLLVTLSLGAAATAQDVRANFTGLSFGLGAGMAGDGGYATGSVAYLFPVGNGSVLAGPVLSISEYSMSTTSTTEAAPKKQRFVLDRVLGEKTTNYDQHLSVGVRVASVLSSGRAFVFGEAGVERYAVTTTQVVFSMNRKVVDRFNDHEFGGYAAVGAEFCATQNCNVAYTGQIRYHGVTKNTSAMLGLNIRF